MSRETVAEAVGRVLVRCGVDSVFGVVGSGNFAVTNAMVAAGARYVAARHEGGAATMADACARWVAEEAPVLGLGVETVGTDAGAAHSFSTPFPCHSFLLGAGKYGLTQLRNLDRLPATGALVVAAPLPIVSGSGSPLRVLALVERG